MSRGFLKKPSNCVHAQAERKECVDEKNAPNGLCVAHICLYKKEAFTVWGCVEIISHIFVECDMTCIA